MKRLGCGRFVDRCKARPSAALAGAVLALSMIGCSPVESYRSMTGIDKNDPDPETAPFSGNMAKAEAAEYPNLATVPVPPTRASTAAERQKLTETLIAEREGARRNTPTAPGPIVPPPMPPPPAFAEGIRPAPASPPARIADASAPAKPAGRNRPESARRKQGEPPEPGPRDTSLETPELASLPDPESVRTPPPPPKLAAAPAPSQTAPLQPPPSIVAAGKPEPAPPPPPPAMASAPPPPPSIPDKSAAKRPPTGATLATIDMPGSAAAPDPGERELIERIAGLYKQRPDTLRIVAYAGTPAPGTDPLDSYRAAMDRAQTVAKLLADGGVPANRIHTEASPAGGGGRVEIQLVP